ncbi:hypothetical protein ACH5RR_018786 [Cinchona calisaya]|uniref:Uncharacterized protein n=1 Tax=Cinchona calisaya TaxID=153742 RepID=A0ABD2ZR49_9GENT
MAHDIPTGSGNSLPERMTRQEQAFSQLMTGLGDLPTGYVLMTDLREIKAISAVLRKHMRMVDATLDSLRQDLSVTKKVVASSPLIDVGIEGTRVSFQGCKLRSIAVLGVASVELMLGPWSGKCSLMAVLLDDFDLILGKEFMTTNKIFPVPHLDGITIADERCPTFIPSVFVNTNAIAGPSSRNDTDKLGGQILAI